MLPSWVPDFQIMIKTWRFTNYTPEPEFYTSARLNPITFLKDFHIVHTDGFFIDAIVDTCVQNTDEALEPLPPAHHDSWTWNIQKIIARLIGDGGICTLIQGERFRSPEDLRRSVKRTIYDFMIAGQICTLTDWVQYDVRYPDEGLLKADPEMSHLPGRLQRTSARAIV